VSQVEAHFGQLEIVLILTQGRYTVCTECVIGSKIILGTPNEILGVVGQVKARLCTFGDSVNLDARKVHGLFQMCIRLRNIFGHTRWNS
jgi:hypothetical protein